MVGKQPRTRSDPNRYNHEEATELDEEPFENADIGRRTFLGLAAATGAALALPGTVSAEVTDDAMTDLAEFVVNATPDDYEAALVLEFEDTDALSAFYDEYGEPDWDVDEELRAPKAVTRESPTPAAHGHLTASEVEHVLNDIGGVEYADFSPGANPFWKLDGGYDDSVFPPAEDARDFISHTETGAALNHLEAEHPDTVRVRRIGQGPGWKNSFTGEDPDPNDIYVAEVTNNVRDEASFQEKDKAVFTLAIHGNERAGCEAGSRIIEDVTTGDADSFSELLDDIVIVFVYINPDGWTVRKPQYASQNPYAGFFGSPFYGHYRGNSSGVDTNRQYPTIGWANPAFWPADPERAPDVRPGYDVGYEDVVPDALATIEHLRGYDNVEYLCDYHMMGFADTMVLNLESNAAYEHDGTHNLDEVNRRIDAAMTDQWESPQEIASDTIRAGKDSTFGDPNDYVPDELLDYGSIYDSLGYNITGGLLGWAGQPEEFGGLGAVTVAPELAMRDFSDWRPYIERHLETAYRLSMQEFAEMTAASTDATVATGGQDTAYVTTDELTRRSADLSHTDESPGKGEGPGQDRATEVQRRHETVQPGPSGRAEASAEERTHSLAARVADGGANEGVVKLVNPGGQVVRTIDLNETDERSFYVPNPASGDWSIELEGVDDVDVEFVTVEADEEHPDPEEAFGYSQAEYVVNPMQFFADLEPNLEAGAMEGVRVHDVRVGKLLRGNSGKRRYDKVVVSHDVGRDDSRYVDELEAFVEAGGDLVLTDTGLNLLAELDVGEAAAIEDGDLQSIRVGIANLIDRDFEHYLLSDIRPLQFEMWKSPQVGYVPNEPDQPATVVDDDAFTDAGGDVAGRMEGQTADGSGADGVAVGALSAGDSEINVLGSVLPPASQRELHPFGMADYAVSFMGHTLLCNALGFQQRRFVEDELVGTWGDVR
ncbi:M14 family zinc carboxypeptidase [Halobacterium sp. R2-5]|uniref:M14 family zinc carboxypeptidase n=1 Tax=Halobacterium sp. R2-5 TaxID=2715751 RepID=UPI001421B284|nr:M14 family zinc carboxypeptidase [Halobacterium sp. R2-5]NIC00881.1 peptidase M14 [Halobacterium sp. R2-5]